MLCTNAFFLIKEKIYKVATCNKHILTVNSRFPQCAKIEIWISPPNSTICTFEIRVSKDHFCFSIIQKFYRVSIFRQEPHVANSVLSVEHAGKWYVGVLSTASLSRPESGELRVASEFAVWFFEIVYFSLHIIPCFIHQTASASHAALHDLTIQRGLFIGKKSIFSLYTFF